MLQLEEAKPFYPSEVQTRTHFEHRDEDDIEARRGRRDRARARLKATLDQWPVQLAVDRLTPTLMLLRACSENRDVNGMLIRAHNQRLRLEVEQLEDRVTKRSRKGMRSGETIRQALDFLRGFGRICALDFSVVADQDRQEVVRLLELEHRWCYAAAGTTRNIFKVAIGRTGAR